MTAETLWRPEAHGLGARRPAQYLNLCAPSNLLFPQAERENPGSWGRPSGPAREPSPEPGLGRELGHRKGGLRSQARKELQVVPSFAAEHPPVISRAHGSLQQLLLARPVERAQSAFHSSRARSFYMKKKVSSDGSYTFRKHLLIRDW